MNYLTRIEGRQARLLAGRQTEESGEGERAFAPSMEAIEAMLGGSSSGPQTAGDYLTAASSVYVCIDRRSQLLTSIPLRVYRLADSERRRLPLARRRGYMRQMRRGLTGLGTAAQKRQISTVGLEEVTDGPLVELLNTVNPFWTFDRLLDMSEKGLGLWGKAFWFLDRKGNPAGLPQEIWTAPGNRIRPVPHPKNYLSHFEYTPVGSVEPIPYALNEVVWFNYGDPTNLYGSLSPLAAAQVNADYEHDSMKANQNLHKQGFQMGGVVFPGDNKTWQEADAGKVESTINKRFRGVDKAHRWAVFRQKVEMKEFGLSPKDAEFLGGLSWSLERICAIYAWPLDLAGGRRTYENLAAALVAAWTQAILPEAAFIASEITEQLLPLFPGEADLVWFDASEVPELQEAELAKWSRAKEQIETGALTINDWRVSQGLEPYAWGDVWWAPTNKLPAGAESRSHGAPEIMVRRPLHLTAGEPTARHQAEVINLNCPICGHAAADRYEDHGGLCVCQACQCTFDPAFVG